MKIIFKDAIVDGAIIFIDEYLDQPIYIGCLFRNTEITTRNKNMTAFAHCTFDDTCKVNTDS